MKNLVVFMLFLLVCIISSSAQPPQGINYQGVARNSGGAILANQPIRLRISIRDSVAAGSIVYRETFLDTTNSLGLFDLIVGTGSVVAGTFNGINWGRNNKFMQVELDPTGGTSYVNMGTTQMMAVPYAFYAEKTASAYNPWADYILVTDQKTGCLVGGGFASTNGWQTRTLNMIIDSSGSAIRFNSSSNSITLSQQGKYYIKASAPGFATYKHRITIQDTLTHINYILGQNAYSFHGTYVWSLSEAEGFISVTSAPTTFVIKHYTSGTSDHENLGVAVQDSVCKQVYTKLFVQKIK